MRKQERPAPTFLTKGTNGLLLSAIFGFLVSLNLLGQGVWQPLGPAGVSVRSAAIDPLSSTTLYIGTDGAGVFKSLDSGATWIAASDDPESLLAGATVKVLVINPQLSTTLYAGTDGFGVFKSTNGGTTWFRVNNGLDPGSDVTALAIDPLNPTTLYTRGTDTYGVFKSIDGGYSWFAANAGLPGDDIPVVVVDPVAPTTIYAGFDSEGIFKSTDGGSTWGPARTGLSLDIVNTLVIDPQAPAILYAGGINFDPGTGSPDGGGVFKSTDGGTNWLAIGLEDLVVKALAVNPDTTSTLYAGTEGQGVFVSNDGGITWSEANRGLPNLLISALATDSERMVFAGSRGDGLFRVPGFALYHPLVVDGMAAETFYTLANAGAASEVVTVEFLDNVGDPLLLPNMNPLPNCGIGCFAVNLGPGESFSGQTGGSFGPLEVGYARVSASSNVRVSITNELQGQQCSLPLVGVDTHASIPVTPAYRSGLFAINPGGGDLTLDLSLFDDSQTLAALAQAPLSSFGRTARFLDEFSWSAAIDFTSFSGSADVQSNLPVATVPITLLPLEFCPRAVPQDISVSTSEGVLTLVQETGNPSPVDTPPGVTFPVGFLAFRVESLLPGSATEVTLVLPPGVVVSTYYKFGPEPGDPTPHWYEFLFDPVSGTGAEILPDRIVLHFVDGERGDNDLTVGVIEDPGGPAFREKLEVDIDIKPGSSPNSINLGSKGGVPVAIFSSAEFDATRIDPLSVTLAGAGAKLKGKGTPIYSFEDVSGDGLVDMVIHVSTETLALTDGDTEAILAGATVDGIPIQGSDSICVVP